MYLESSNDKNPNTHQYIVTTPKGTTIEGLTMLNKHKFKFAVCEAISSANNRANEIEQEKMKNLNEKYFNKN